MTDDAGPPVGDDPRFADVRRLIDDGLAARVAPAIAVEVGRRADPIWRHAAGRLTYAADAAPCEPSTPFDLASLTKVIATTSVAMHLVRTAALDLDTRPADLFEGWQGAGRRDITVRHLLEHSSGLPAHQRLWERGLTRESLTTLLAGIAPERDPGVAAVYSDLGFLLLGAVLERRAGARIDEPFSRLAADAGPLPGYCPPRETWASVAPTEYDPWRGRLLAGEVHDENAAALGGVAPHAGLFGTAASVGRFARLVLETRHAPTPLGDPAVLETFMAPSRVPGSTRALGWDTMRPTSSCGTRLSSAAIGHTGFTGTSLWIDPSQDVYVVLLTNRVYPTRANDAIRRFRPALHDAVMRAVAPGGTTQ